MRRIPFLITFEIGYSGSIEDWEDGNPSPIPTLIRSLWTPAMLPGLQNFTVRTGGIFDRDGDVVPYQDILSLLNTRREPHGALRSFHLYVEPTDPAYNYLTKEYAPPRFCLAHIDAMAQTMEIRITNEEYNWPGGTSFGIWNDIGDADR